MSPTQLTLRELRDRGYICKTVERWNPFAKIRQDLWGFDVIAAKRGEALLVQCTTVSNTSARIKKIEDMDSTMRLREAGFKLLVWGWKKIKNRWTVVETDIS